jgi:hypothetical protein
MRYFSNSADPSAFRQSLSAQVRRKNYFLFEEIKADPELG